MTNDRYWLSAYYNHQGQEPPDQPDFSWDPITGEYGGSGTWEDFQNSIFPPWWNFPSQGWPGATQAQCAQGDYLNPGDTYIQDPWSPPFYPGEAESPGGVVPYEAEVWDRDDGYYTVAPGAPLTVGTSARWYDSFSPPPPILQAFWMLYVRGTGQVKVEIHTDTNSEWTWEWDPASSGPWQVAATLDVSSTDWEERWASIPPSMLTDMVNDTYAVKVTALSGSVDVNYVEFRAASYAGFHERLWGERQGVGPWSGRFEATVPAALARRVDVISSYDPEISFQVEQWPDEQITNAAQTSRASLGGATPDTTTTNVNANPGQRQRPGYFYYGWGSGSVEASASPGSWNHYGSGSILWLGQARANASHLKYDPSKVTPPSPIPMPATAIYGVNWQSIQWDPEQPHEFINWNFTGTQDIYLSAPSAGPGGLGPPVPAPAGYPLGSPIFRMHPGWVPGSPFPAFGSGVLLQEGPPRTLGDGQSSTWDPASTILVTEPDALVVVEMADPLVAVSTATNNNLRVTVLASPAQATAPVWRYLGGSVCE